MTIENLERRLDALQKLVDELKEHLLIFGEKMTLQSTGEILIHTPRLRLETERLDVEGESYVKLSYSQPFTWKSSQPKLKLIHKEKGFPIITSLKGNMAGADTRVQTYIDESDNYWYLAGKGAGGKLLEVQVVCVGKVSGGI